MTDELQRAAERLRACNYESDWDLDGASFQQISDWQALAKAYLAEHPADDGEAVTVEWLESIGWLEDQTGWPAICLRETSEWGISWRGHGIWLTPMSVPLYRAPTRGDVRRLCRALGIALKETTNG